MSQQQQQQTEETTQKNIECNDDGNFQRYVSK
jgi:hypothetical protein